MDIGKLREAIGTEHANAVIDMREDEERGSVWANFHDGRATALMVVQGFIDEMDTEGERMTDEKRGVADNLRWLTWGQYMGLLHRPDFGAGDVVMCIGVEGSNILALCDSNGGPARYMDDAHYIVIRNPAPAREHLTREQAAVALFEGKTLEHGDGWRVRIVGGVVQYMSSYGGPWEHWVGACSVVVGSSPMFIAEESDGK